MLNKKLYFMPLLSVILNVTVVPKDMSVTVPLKTPLLVVAFISETTLFTSLIDTKSLFASRAYSADACPFFVTTAASGIG